MIGWKYVIRSWEKVKSFKRHQCLLNLEIWKKSFSISREKNLWLCISISFCIGLPQLHSVLHIPCLHFALCPHYLHSGFFIACCHHTSNFGDPISQSATIPVGQRKQYSSNFFIPLNSRRVTCVVRRYWEQQGKKCLEERFLLWHITIMSYVTVVTWKFIQFICSYIRYLWIKISD